MFPVVTDSGGEGRTLRLRLTLVLERVGGKSFSPARKGGPRLGGVRGGGG